MTIEKLNASTPDLTQQNVERLLELFPECRTEGSRADAAMVDFDLLRQALSDHLVDGPAERYRLDWPGKRQALLTANTPIDKTLRPMRENSVNFDTTRNLFIEGDNLDALKLIQETYLGSVKLIYIDPPYNTGKDFIYKDNFTKSREEYEEETGQRDEQRGRLVANPETSGRFHSDWLSMMLPRLKLAKNILSHEGALALSIGADEVSAIRPLLDEVFGEKNRVALFSVRTGNQTEDRFFVKNTDFLYIYAKDVEQLTHFIDRKDQSARCTTGKESQSQPEIEFPAGIQVVGVEDGIYEDTDKTGGPEDIQLIRGPIVVEGGRLAKPITLKARWSNPNDMRNYIARHLNGGSSPIFNKFGKELTRLWFKGRRFQPQMDKIGFDLPYAHLDSFTKNGSDALKSLIGSSDIDYPKHPEFIAAIVNWFTGDGDVVFDFFAGSGTTAEAVFRANAQRQNNRRFILVQLSDMGDEDRPPNESGIAELCQKRIIAAGEAHADVLDDTGFRSFRVENGNFVDTRVTPKEAKQEALEGMVSHIKADRNDEDLLFGALLRWGVDISFPIEQRELAGRTAWLVDAPSGGNGKGAALIACFARPASSGNGGIDTELADAIAELAPLRVLFRDDGFANDAIKENVHSRFHQRAPDTQVRVL